MVQLQSLQKNLGSVGQMLTLEEKKSGHIEKNGRPRPKLFHVPALCI